MATLERERESATAEPTSVASPDGPVPTPFPAAERTTSRSPSATRAGNKVGAIFGKVRRAISSSRERSNEDGGRDRTAEQRRVSVASV